MKKRIIKKTFFSNGVPTQEAWDMTTIPPSPYLVENIPSIAKPCHDCGCSGGSSGTGVVPFDAGFYISDAAAGLAGCEVGEYYLLALNNVYAMAEGLPKQRID